MEDDWMTAEGAAAVLRRSTRQVRTYAQQRRLRSRRRGPQGRVEYLAADVYALANELGSERDLPRIETAEIVPAVQLANQIERLNEALRDAEVRAAQAEAALRLLPAPGEAQAWRAERDAAKAEAATLRELLAEARGGRSMAWRLALFALAVALLAVGALLVLALLR